MFKCLEKIQVLCLLIFIQIIPQEDGRQQTRAICWIQILSGLFKVGNIFVFLRLFSFLKGYYLSLIGSERHTPPPVATDEDGGWVWAIAPPIYLTLCFIL